MKNALDKALFKKELSHCRRLHRENGGRCAWGTCATCGVIPLLYKLRNGERYEGKGEIEKIKKDVWQGAESNREN